MFLKLWEYAVITTKIDNEERNKGRGFMERVIERWDLEFPYKYLSHLYSHVLLKDKKNNMLRFAQSSSEHSQSAFICSKLTIETLEQGVKYVQS